MAYRRREFTNEFPIHVSGRSNNREAFPIPLEEVWIILSNYLWLVNRMYGLNFISFVLMPNHFHLILTDPLLRMAAGMEYFMRESSREISRLAGRINRLWGGPYHSSVINNPLYFLQCYKYVYRNPVKAKLASSVIDYPFSTLPSLIGQGRSILTLEEDCTLFEDVEGTLKWLDFPFQAEDEESIRRGLKRKEFYLAKDRKNLNKPSRLESWDSVPKFFWPNLTR